MSRRQILAGAAALAVSGALHAAGLALAVGQVPAVELEGGGETGPSVLGGAFADFAAGGAPVSPAAVAAVSFAITPAAAAPQAASAAAVPVRFAAPAAAVVPATPREAAAVAAPSAVPSSEPELAAQPLRTAAAPPGAAVADAAPAPTLRPASPPEPPRHAALPDTAPAKAKPGKPTPSPPKAQPAPAGNAAADANRGSADAEDGARAVASGARRTVAAEAGRAAAANYPGLVLRQITRLRKPAAPDRGRVVVRFSIAPSGDLAAVNVTVSSGSAALDRLALDHIRRAAPFPPPPAGAERTFSFEFVGRK